MSTTSLSDSLPPSVPKLEASGVNWPIFSIRFQDAVEAKGVWSHFDGSAPRPTSASAQVPTPQAGATVEAAASVADPTLQQWLKDEMSAKSLLTQKLPDSALLLVRSAETVKERWDIIVKEYTSKGTYARTSMRRQFLSMRCGERENVKEFLDKLRVRREELMSMGVVINDEDYLTVIVDSVPNNLQVFASTQYHSGQNDPDRLIQIIGDEYTRQQARRTKKTPKDADDDEAMAATTSSSGNKRRGKGGKGGACFKCGKIGHFKRDCPERKKEYGGEGKDQGKDKGKQASTANAVETDSDDEGAFAAGLDSDDESMPDLVDISDSSDSDDASDVETDSEDWLVDCEDDSDTWSDEELTLKYPEEEPSMSAAELDSGMDSESYDTEWDGSQVHCPLRLNEPAGIMSDDEESDEEGVEAALVSTEETQRRNCSLRTELYDSGCSKHLTPYKDDLCNFRDTEPKSLKAANKQTFCATGVGELTIDVPNGVDTSKLHLVEVLYSPNVGHTLVSIGRLDDCGFEVSFANGKCTIKGPQGNTIGVIPKTHGGLYKVTRMDDSANAVNDGITLDQLHRRLGHISPKTAKKLVEDGLVHGLSLDNSGPIDIFCESCVYAKATRKPIPKVREGERAAEFGGEVHSDVWGPARVETLKGKKYYVTFTDDKTRLTHVHFLRSKDEVFEAYKTFEAWAKNQLDAKIKVLHSDRGGEYTGKAFTVHLKKQGTHQKLTVHDTPQHNGVAERRNRTILERARAVLHASGLPRMLWGEACRHIVWLMNRTSTKALDGVTPYEAVFKKKPDLSMVREWGEETWVRVEAGDKLGGRVEKGRWVGYDDNSKGHRIYWPSKRRVTVERNVTFNNSATSQAGVRTEGENVPRVSTTPVNNSKDVPTTQLPGIETPEPPQPMPETTQPPPLNVETDVTDAETQYTTKRVRKPTRRVQDLLDGEGTYAYRRTAPKLPTGVQQPSTQPQDKEKAILEGEGSATWMMGIEDELALVVETSEVEGLEPRSLHEAKSRPDWPQWEQAIHDELNALNEAGTWELVDPPEGANIVGSKWVFRVKKDAAGNIVRYKARLVAQGFSQVPGVDYFDTFAPVAKLASIRTILAIAAAENWELHQIDVKSAYLNGKLTGDEQIYMKQPPGFHAPNSHGQVCRLIKTLYGLKQAGRRWYQMLCSIMVDKLGFTRCDVDQAVFFKNAKDEKIIILVHVDDFTIAASSIKLIVAFKASIAKYVEISDLGEIHWLLGMEIKRQREHRTIHISQRSYIDSLVTRYLPKDAKPLSLPLNPNITLSSKQSPSTTQEYARMRDLPYRELVGSLMYAALGTRPDIAFAVQTLSRFNQNPGLAHWEEAIRCLRYLKGTRDYWLSYGGGRKEMVGYGDADGSMAEDRHAISGYAFMLHGGAISWSAKRQEIIVLSTTEAEYVAATHAAKEALWLRSLISQLFGTTLPPTSLFSDNQSAIALTKDHQYHARTKHIDIRFHFIRWIIEQGSLRLIYCPTEDMVADALTKALPSTKVKHFAKELGLSLV